MDDERTLKASKNALSHLAESEEKYRRLFEFSEDPMWLILDNKFEICNDAAVSVLGYESQEELANTHPSALSPPIQPDGIDSFTKAEQMMTAALENGYHRFEWTHRKKDGMDFPVEVTLTSIPYDGGTGIYCVWRDISARKAMEEELVEAKAAAEAASLAKSKFLALMSHELRTPLNAVIGFSELLEAEAIGPLDKKQLEIVGNIHQGGTILLNLVNDLLDFTRVESGEFDTCTEKVNIADAITKSIAIVQDLAERRNITIHWTPEKIKLGPAQGDQLRLVQCIVNLFSNAIKYNQPGGDIWVSVRDEGDQCAVAVRDNGCGIKPDKIDRIFEAFERGDQSSGTIEGTGLGLNVCKRLLEAMGGSVSVESEWQKGSTFTIRLRSGEPEQPRPRDDGPDLFLD